MEGDRRFKVAVDVGFLVDFQSWSRTREAQTALPPEEQSLPIREGEPVAAVIEEKDTAKQQSGSPELDVADYIVLPSETPSKPSGRDFGEDVPAEEPTSGGTKGDKGQGPETPVSPSEAAAAERSIEEDVRGLEALLDDLDKDEAEAVPRGSDSVSPGLHPTLLLAPRDGSPELLERMAGKRPAEDAEDQRPTSRPRLELFPAGTAETRVPVPLSDQAAQGARIRALERQLADVGGEMERLRTRLSQRDREVEQLKEDLRTYRSQDPRLTQTSGSPPPLDAEEMKAWIQGLDAKYESCVTLIHAERDKRRVMGEKILKRLEASDAATQQLRVLEERLNQLDKLREGSDGRATAIEGHVQQMFEAMWPSNPETPDVFARVKREAMETAVIVLARHDLIRLSQRSADILKELVPTRYNELMVLLSKNDADRSRDDAPPRSKSDRERRPRKHQTKGREERTGEGRRHRPSTSQPRSQAPQQQPQAARPEARAPEQSSALPVVGHTEYDPVESLGGVPWS